MVQRATRIRQCEAVEEAVSGIYLMLTCYVPKGGDNAIQEHKPPVGLDFGIKTTITTSEGEKYDMTVRESERLKGLQKKLARQKKGSRGWYDTKHLIRREYEKLANRRRAKANQAYHDITKGRRLIVIQDENIAGPCRRQVLPIDEDVSELWSHQ